MYVLFQKDGTWDAGAIENLMYGLAYGEVVLGIRLWMGLPHRLKYIPLVPLITTFTLLSDIYKLKSETIVHGLLLIRMIIIMPGHLYIADLMNLRSKWYINQQCVTFLICAVFLLSNVYNEILGESFFKVTYSQVMFVKSVIFAGTLSPFLLIFSALHLFFIILELTESLPPYLTHYTLRVPELLALFICDFIIFNILPCYIPDHEYTKKGHGFEPHSLHRIPFAGGSYLPPKSMERIRSRSRESQIEVPYDPVSQRRRTLQKLSRILEPVSVREILASNV